MSNTTILANYRAPITDDLILVAKRHGWENVEWFPGDTRENHWDTIDRASSWIDVPKGLYGEKVGSSIREKIDIEELLEQEVERVLRKKGLIVDDKIYEDITELAIPQHLWTRIETRLRAENINKLGELATSTENRLLKIPNLGRKSVDAIKKALSEKGLGLSAG